MNATVRTRVENIAATRPWETSPRYRELTSNTVTPIQVALVQRWLGTRIGQRGGLLIERVGERNRVLLRIEREFLNYEAEVSVLNRYRKTHPRASPEAVLALFHRTG